MLKASEKLKEHIEKPLTENEKLLMIKEFNDWVDEQQHEQKTKQKIKSISNMFDSPEFKSEKNKGFILDAVATIRQRANIMLHNPQLNSTNQKNIGREIKDLCNAIENLVK